MSASKFIDQTCSDATDSNSALPLLSRPKTSPIPSSDHPETITKLKKCSLNISEEDSNVNNSNSDYKRIRDQPPPGPPTREVIDFQSELAPDKDEQHRPAFAPFFTLINTSGTISHPREVHYLFSDDDTNEVLTSALLRSLSRENPSSTSPVLLDDLETTNTKTSQKAVSKPSKIPPAAISSRHGLSIRDNREGSDGSEKEIESEERVIIVDLKPSGDSISSISSLCSKWQILNAEIVKAPTWNGADDTYTQDTNDTSGNMMLKIDGVALSDLSKPETTSAIAAFTGNRPDVTTAEGTTLECKSVSDEDELWNILEGFNQKLVVLRRIIGTQSRLDSQDTVLESEVERRLEGNRKI